jgi:hypothetical protein
MGVILMLNQFCKESLREPPILSNFASEGIDLFGHFKYFFLSQLPTTILVEGCGERIPFEERVW